MDLQKHSIREYIIKYSSVSLCITIWIYFVSIIVENVEEGIMKKENIRETFYSSFSQLKKKKVMIKRQSVLIVFTLNFIAHFTLFPPF